jgi:DNA replication protein DnaC
MTTLFTLPPAPDELENAREREEAEEAKRKRFELARKLWQDKVPATFRRPVPELTACCTAKLRAALGQVDTISALLIGPTRVGKSTAAAVLVRRALNAFTDDGSRYPAVRGLVWANALDLAIAERRHPLGAGEPEPVQAARNASLLVLDDLGLEPEGTIWPLIAHRYDHRLPTITTSGLTTKGLTKHLGSAGVRRLTEQHAGCPVLLVDCHPAEERKK